MSILADKKYYGSTEGELLIHYLFEQQVQQHPDVVAVQFGDERITYAEMNSRATQLSEVISATSPEALVVGVSATRSIATMVSLFAILKAGKAYLPLDPTFPAERLQDIILDSGMDTCLAPAADADIFGKLVKNVIISDGDIQATAELPARVAKTGIAYIIYTSGSTGKPKGVCVAHAGPINLVKWNQRIAPYLGVGHRTLQFSPLIFDASVMEIFCTLCTGGTMVLVQDEVRIDPIRLLKYINDQQVNRIIVTFVALQYLTEAADAEQFFTASLQDVISAGEQLKITPQILRFFKALPGCIFYNMYGPTEASVCSTALKLEGSPDGWPLLPNIGKPIDGVDIVVLDEQLQQVPAGEHGELCISGISLAEGYLNRAELTAEKFVDWVDNQGNIRKVYRSGDLCLYLPDGNIEYLGRKDTQVKIRGNRVEIGEIEVLLNQMDGIQQSVVAAREDVPGQKRLVAYLKAADGEKKDVSYLRDNLEQHLPDYMIPSAFVWVDGFVETTSGKIDRNKLPAPDMQRPELSVLYQAPANPTEKRIAHYWAELLQIDMVGVYDNFFELGGNSILALKTVAALKKQYNYSLPITKLYQYPTVNGIASYIDGNKTIARVNAIKPKNQGNQDIAVVGMAVRFPGANNIDELWQLLTEGRESTSFFSDEELDKSIPFEIRNAPNYVKARGIVEGAQGFDAAFFGINPKVAELMDPQQRVFMELAWEALETSGHLPDHYNGVIGVYGGVGNNTYYINNVLAHPDKIENIGRFLTATINEKDYIATRTAYELNLTGPAVSVHAACSTSLLAIAQAADAIRNGQCTVALAGGASINTPVKSGHLYQQGTMLSADGHCRPFDAESDGTIFSDGAGIVVLKNMDDAIKDGDTIYAVLKGIGVNNDGGGKGSFTAPSATGQAGAIAMAIADARVEPASISYVEAHGTATSLGDPIEIEGLNLAFGKQEHNQYCAIGSIKSNMGHLVAAAGVAGFIKTTLALYHRQIPPSLHFSRPNPNIDFAESPFFVNTSLRKWELAGKRIAGVSSFGVGGTNVHTILEEYQQNEDNETSEQRPFELISWSAKTATSASKYADRLYYYLQDHPEACLSDIAYSLHTTRADMRERNFIVADSRDDLMEKLVNYKRDVTNSKVLNQQATEVVFMFPGQGAQYLNMGHELYKNEPVFAAAIDECVAILQGTPHAGILDIIYAADTAEATEKLKNTFYTQPAIFITSYAMARLWMSWGIEPAILMGHSIGEFVAAHLAGIFGLEDALKLITERARLVSEVAEGDMLSVRIAPDELEKILPVDLSIAAVNSNKLSVVAGTKAAVAAFAAQLEEKGIPGRMLQTSHAFHSAMMDGIVAPFENVVRAIKLNRPVKPVLSTVTGDWLTEAEATDPAYWANHLRKTVNFALAVDRVSEEKGRVLLEVGPGRTLATLAAQQTPADVVTTIAGLDSSQGQREYISVLKAMGQLWLNGINPNWNKFYRSKYKRLTLPAYAFDHKIYWVEPGQTNPAETVNYQPGEVVPDSPLTIQENTIQNTMTRKDFLAEKLQGIFADAAGIDIDSASADVSFPEIGFDSLLLTQIATNLKKTFNVNITFRKLFEDYNSINLLADFLDKTIPAGQFEPAPAPQVATPAATKQSVYHQAAPMPQAVPTMAMPLTGNGSEVALNMISQQLQLLAGQIAQLQGYEVATANHTPIIPQPTPNELQSEPVAPLLLDQEPEVTAEEMVEIKKPFGATARIERKVQELDDIQMAWLADLTKRYNDKTRKSKEQTQQHRTYMADPRVVSGFRPLTKEVVYPIVINKSKGNRLWDVDGNEYIDALNGFGSNMLGYQPDVLKKAILEQIEMGYEIGPQHELAGEVCKLMCEFTGHDRAALCNTGSEAVLGAMRIARTVSGRSIIVAFSGSYHGIMDEVIVRGTKKLKTFPAASGILPENVQNMLILDYGTDEALRIIGERADEIAAVLVEPVQSRRPEFQPVEFLKNLRTLTAEKQICLVFDEVISGFRFHPGGTQALFGIKADLGTYGKVIGGGMPVGAICGKTAYMDALDGGFWQYGDDSVPEVGVTYFAGTFVRHPLALAAAKASLLYMKERGPALQEKLTGLAKRLREGMEVTCRKLEVPVSTVGFGSLWRIKFLEDIPYSELLFTLMRLKGVHILDGFPCFMTDAHTEQDIDFMIGQFNQSIREMVEVGFFKQSQSISLAADHEAKPVNLEAMNTPPVAGARLGRDKEGNPAWFIEDKANPGKYLQYNISNN